MNCAYPYRVSGVPHTCHAARVIPQIWDQSNGLFHSLLSASYCNLWKTERKSDLDVVFSKGPADLLSSQAMQDLVAESRLKYDYIVVDASPAFELLGNTDDLRRGVAPTFTTTAFSKIDI
jgi:hypothetical protein